MIPGVDPRQMKAMMRQMGMSQEDISATRVTIETPNGVLVFENPNVQKVIMQGQTTFQIIGNYSEEAVKLEIKISQDDIEVVKSQAKVSTEEAKKSLEESNGDIAEAILKLSNN